MTLAAAAIWLPFLSVMLMLGAIVRELRMLRQRLGGHVAFLPWNED